MSDSQTSTDASPSHAGNGGDTVRKPDLAPKEVGGPKEKDPTRYGDWTVKGRCIDF